MATIMESQGAEKTEIVFIGFACLCIAFQRVDSLVFGNIPG